MKRMNGFLASALMALGIMSMSSTLSAQPPVGRGRGRGAIAAQPPQGAGRGGRAGRGAGMQAARQANPARAVLRLRDRLNLSDDQVKRLEAIAATQDQAARPSQADRIRLR